MAWFFLTQTLTDVIFAASVMVIVAKPGFSPAVTTPVRETDATFGSLIV